MGWAGLIGRCVVLTGIWRGGGALFLVLKGRPLIGSGSERKNCGPPHRVIMSSYVDNRSRRPNILYDLCSERMLCFAHSSSKFTYRLHLYREQSHDKNYVFQQWGTADCEI